MSRSSADEVRIKLVKDILSYFKKKNLRSITAKDVELWMEKLQDRGLKNITINGRIKTLSVMFNEAVRRDLITDNPLSRFPKLKDDSRERGILTLQKVQELFDVARKEELWNHQKSYLANLLAACTGVRMGEVRGLRFCDVREGYLHICKQYKDRYGITDTKTHTERDVSLPSFLSEELEHLRNSRNTEDLIFSLKG